MYKVNIELRKSLSLPAEYTQCDVEFYFFAVHQNDTFITILYLKILSLLHVQNHKNKQCLYGQHKYLALDMGIFTATINSMTF